MTPSRALDLVMAASTAGPAPRTPLLLPTPLDAITAEQASARDTSSPCTHEYAHHVAAVPGDHLDEPGDHVQPPGEHTLDEHVHEHTLVNHLS